MTLVRLIIEGLQYPLEVPFVHYNSKYPDLPAALGSGAADALLAMA